MAAKNPGIALTGEELHRKTTPSPPSTRLLSATSWWDSGPSLFPTFTFPRNNPRNIQGKRHVVRRTAV
jgi:hypothetical protein